MYIDDSWNDDIYEDFEPVKYKNLKVYSRDWTVETIFNQIKHGYIDLNPKFQRKIAWKDDKRSMLIESLILRVPVPQIVLAEDPYNANSFIVIDGKQRLLTILDFLEHGSYSSWNTGRLKKLKVRHDLNGKAFNELDTQTQRDLLNSDIRCTIISNVKDPEILYDIFFRINTGSVPLSTQELRQVLNRGEFAEYLYYTTTDSQEIHCVMGITGSDDRLRDIEILLRFFSIVLLGGTYRGNLKKFLDESMEIFTVYWEEYNSKIASLYKDFNNSIKKLESIFSYEYIGRKLSDKKIDRKFNKVLFEVQVYYFMYVEDELLTDQKKEEIRLAFTKLCDNSEFIETLEHTTQAVVKYENRFELFEKHIIKNLNLYEGDIPLPIRR